MSTETLVRVAHVEREHGLRGAVTVTALGGDIRRFNAGLRLRSESSGAVFTVARAQAGSAGTVVLTLREITTREDAERLRGEYLCVERAARRQLSEHEWFVSDLVGMLAIDRNGERVGTVSEVMSNTAQDVIVLDTPKGEALLPLVSAFVDSIDIDARVMVVNPWEWDDES